MSENGDRTSEEQRMSDKQNRDDQQLPEEQEQNPDQSDRSDVVGGSTGNKPGDDVVGGSDLGPDIDSDSSPFGTGGGEVY